MSQDAADASWTKGDIPAAASLYAARLARDSTDDRALHRLALIRAWNDDYDGSLALFDQLLVMSPDNREAAVDRARVLAWRGDLSQALASVDAMLTEDPSYIPALRARAQFLGWSARYRDAEAVYERLLAYDPTDREALLGLARVLGWSGRLDSAERVYHRLLDTDPENTEAQQHLAVIRQVMHPKARTRLTAESDTDDNDITTVTLTGGWRPRPDVELSGEAYGRTASVAGAFRRHSYGATAFGLYQFDAGWRVRGGLGLVGTDGTGASSFVRVLASIRSPGDSKAGGGLGYARQPFDYTAQAIELGVWHQDVVAHGWYRAGGGLRVDGSASIAWFQGTESNRRLSARVAADHRVTPSWTLGATFRVFGFEKDLQEGYFDPDLYWLGEAVGGWRPSVGVLRFDFVVAPGLQQIGTGGAVELAGRAAAQVNYAIAPGRDVGAFVRLSSAGMDGFSTASSDYRNLAIGLTVSWVF